MEVKNNPISEIINDSIKNLKSVFDVDNVIGKPVDLGNGEKVFPIIKVTVGYIGGGGEFINRKVLNKIKTNDLPFAGGSSAGYSASPIGFLIVRKNNSEMVTVENENVFANILKNLSDGFSEFVKLKGKQGLKKVDKEIEKNKKSKKGDKYE